MMHQQSNVADGGVSPGSIRRHMTLASLPETERAAVMAGASAKRILETKALDDKRSKMQERIAIDERTGEFSDRIADAILDFCRTVNGVPESPISESELELYLGEPRNELRELESLGVHGIKFLKRFNLRKRFKLTRPSDLVDDSWTGKGGAVSWMANRAKSLANFLLAEAAEIPIRERATRAAEQRRKELRIKITPQQAREQMNAWRVRVVYGPPLRKHWY